MNALQVFPLIVMVQWLPFEVQCNIWAVTLNFSLVAPVGCGVFGVSGFLKFPLTSKMIDQGIPGP